jgi:hypothetical protein
LIDILEGWYSHKHRALGAPVYVWTDVNNKEVRCTAVFGTRQGAAGYRYEDKVNVGKLIEFVKKEE